MPHTTTNPLSGSPDPGELLGHVDWLRRLARALVRDEASADDLVQDAVGVAIATKTPIRDLRGFLAGTVRRLANRARRSDVRREHRDRARAAGVDLELPATDELAERVDTLRIVLEELRELPRAQQRVVSLRYLDDLDATEIARREGTSLSTVRSHLARGIAALRERLDRRAGGRDGWCTVLAPWALPGAPLPTGPVSEIPVSEPTTALHAAGLTGAALGVTGVLAMTLKIAVLSLVPIALAGVWYASGDHDVPVDATLARSAEADGGAPSELADIASRSDAAREVLPVEVPSTAAAAKAASSDLEDGFARVEGQVIDALTGEPVPFLHLSVVQGESDENGMKHSVSVKTDAFGRFTSPFDSLPVGTVELTAIDGHGGVMSRPRAQTLTFPLEEPVEVRVGPTFHLGLPADLFQEDGQFTVRYDRVTGTNGMRTNYCVVRAGGSAGEPPWARFPISVLDLEGDGPWGLSLRSVEGLLHGRAEVTRKSGIEPSLVVFELETYGAIEFRLTLTDGAQIPGARVEVHPVEELAGEDVARVLLNQHLADGTIRGRLRFAEAGHYRWSFGVDGSDASGDVEVIVGEVTVVDLTLDDVGQTFDSYVLIDATAVPEIDPGTWSAFVMREDDPSSQSMASLVRDETDPEGFWRINVTSLRAGRWVVGVYPSEGVELVPGTVHVSPGDSPAIIVATSAGPSVDVSLRVVDDVTGDPIDEAEAVYIVSLTDLRMSTTDPNGGLEPESLPLNREATILVRAPGYRAVSLHHQPSRDGLEVEVRLVRGWANRIVVVDLTVVEFVSGVSVFVEGEFAGRTDSDGALRIQGDAPPKSVEVGTDDPSIHVQQSPFDVGYDDPLTGYIFIIVRR